MTPTSLAGNRVLFLVGPQVMLGAMLALVPDVAHPVAAQVLVLLHVASAIASVLALVVWLGFHARGRVVRPPPVDRHGIRGRHLMRLLLVATVLVAYGTGVAATWGGQGSTAGDLHAVAGLLAALPLAIHLLLDGSGPVRAFAWAYMLVAPLAIPAVRSALRDDPEPLARVGFAKQTRDVALYDRAEWCGGCHTDQFDEWQHSTHARALSLPALRETFERTMREEGKNIVDTDLDEPSNGQGFACIQCHSPPTFYGLDKRPVLEDTMLSTQGISCSFCHTVRARGPDRYYISAPETVSRYLGQGSSVVLFREIGDLLIRWRPEAHRRDYHAPVLDRSAFCGGCHFDAYESWRRSSFAAGAPDAIRAEAPDAAAPVQATGAVVECQDCHMARSPDTHAVVEPGRLVPWGPVRRQRRAHAWPGGNVRAANSFHDADALRLDRSLRPGMATLRITELRREEGFVRVTVLVRNEHVGHFFPSGEGGDVRNPFLSLQIFDGQGAMLDGTVPSLDRKLAQTEGPGRSVGLTHQIDDKDTPAERDTRVPPGGELSFHLSLPDRPGGVRARVELRSAFDPEPVLFAEAPL